MLGLIYWLYPRQKPRRRSATGVFLWRAGAARSRRRLDLRLWLLLVAGASVILALAGPWVRGPSPAVAVVLDASASMAAGQRWQKARAAARRLISRARRAVLVRAGRRVQSFGPAPGANLVRTLDTLRPGDRGADLLAGVAAARAALPGATVWVVSDAAPPAGTGYINVAGEEPNLGIVALEPGFLALGNAGPGARAAQVRVNGRPYRVTVPARGFAGVTLAETTRARAEIPGRDALPLDDRDDLLVRRPQVYAPGAGPGLARLLALLSAQPVPEKDAEVAILEATPASPPERPTLFFAPGSGGEAVVVDRDPADPLLLGSGLLGERLAVPPPPGPGFRPVALGPKGEGLIWRSGRSYYLPPLASLQNRPFFPLWVARFLHPFRYQKRPLGADGVWTPGVRNGAVYALEAPFETLLPRPRPSRAPPGSGRRPLGGALLLLAALALLAESRLAGKLGP